MGDDFDLLEAWRAGDEQAGNALFRRHFRTLFTFFSTKIDGPVDDLVQETFLGCVRGRDRFRHDASFKAYLTTIARNRLYSYYKKRERGFDPMHSSAVDGGASPSSVIMAGEARSKLLAALRRIPLEFQVTLELYYWEGLKGPQLAQSLEISDHTVRSRLSRARARLREELQALAEVPAHRLETIERDADFDAWAADLAPAT
ncbi:MAG: sigma-70 family RNA polymerase sigma factor [Myxococcota bacterium]